MTVGLQIDIKFKGEIKENILKEIVSHAKLTPKDEIKVENLEAIIIEESHLMIVKRGDSYYVSIYTCGEPEKEERALVYLLKNSKIKDAKMLFLERGLGYGEEKKMKDPRGLFKEIVGFYPKSFEREGKHQVIDARADGKILERVENFKFLGNPIAKYNFEPWGASGIIYDENRILTFHTWPEYGLATFDLYNQNLEDARKLLERIKGNGRVHSFEY